MGVALAASLAAFSIASGGLGAQAPVGGQTGAEPGRLAVVRELGFDAVALGELRDGFLELAIVQGGVLRGRLAGQPLVLHAGSPFLRFGSRTYQLANAPYVRGGEMRVPLELVEDWWPRVRPAPGEAATSSRAPRRRSGPFRVVIDPGHGGKDPGTSGRGGTREKNVVLAIARRMYEQLKQQPGVEPILTRDRDVFIGLRQRSRVAVAREADLFVSIHANWARDRRASGFETFFLSAARTEEAREVAVRENASAQYEVGETYAEMSDLDFILAGLDRNENVRESRWVAGLTQNALRTVRDTPDRGVKQAGFWVLVGASGNMPTVLVEVGFLSNPDEERTLASEAGQRRIAESLVRGILEYRNSLERRAQEVSSGAAPR